IRDFHVTGVQTCALPICFGMSGDAHHMTAPSENGEGAARCMVAALRDAGIDSSKVGYINAHGTSTPQGDLAETMGIKSVFGAHRSEERRGGRGGRSGGAA